MCTRVKWMNAHAQRERKLLARLGMVQTVWYDKSAQHTTSPYLLRQTLQDRLYLYSPFLLFRDLHLVLKLRIFSYFVLALEKLYRFWNRHSPVMQQLDLREVCDKFSADIYSTENPISRKKTGQHYREIIRLTWRRNSTLLIGRHVVEILLYPCQKWRTVHPSPKHLLKKRQSL